MDVWKPLSLQPNSRASWPDHRPRTSATSSEVLPAARSTRRATFQERSTSTSTPSWPANPARAAAIRSPIRVFAAAMRRGRRQRRPCTWSSTMAHRAGAPLAPGGCCAGRATPSPGPGRRSRRLDRRRAAAETGAADPARAATSPRARRIAAPADRRRRGGAGPARPAAGRTGGRALPGRGRADRPRRRPHSGRGSAPTTENLSEDGRFLPAEVLAARFAELGAKDSAEVGVYCGSGVSAAQEVLALAVAGIPAALYVGSWSEWSAGATARSPPAPAGLTPRPGGRANR